MVRICVAGSKGKMGQRILELASGDEKLEVTGGFDMGDDAEEAIGKADCVIDFSTPKASAEHAEICAKLGKAIVIGTTGLSDEEAAKVRTASSSVPVVFSPNMSVGVNLLFKMVSDAAKTLGPEYTVEVVEAHHIHKKDSPSGTAKEIARIVKQAHPQASVPIESIRENEIVGEHTITFDSIFDTMEITHSAKTRDIFAKGALEAARFAASKKKGLYSMKDVLGL